MNFLINAIEAIHYPTSVNRFKVHTPVSLSELGNMLRGVSFWYHSNILYFLEEKEEMKKKLLDAGLSIEEHETQPISLKDEETRNILTIFSYKATRFSFRQKGLICGRIGKRGSYFRNVCLIPEPIQTIGSHPRIGQLHQSMDFYLDFIKDKIVLFLIPKVKLLVPLSNILSHNLLQIQNQPCCFVAICDEYCESRCFLPRLILAPSPDEPNKNYFEVLSKKEMCPDSRDVRLFVRDGIIVPEKALFLLSSPRQQRRLGLSRRFVSFQAYRYAGKVRSELFEFLSSLAENDEIIIPFTSDQNLIFDRHPIAIGGTKDE